ncbi:hypothetical protein C1645_853631 [Glomus cerebriforme]|uniref:Uncharacterized protein n=1 Tax=Glomus cerebriforme TaxID=658196 RepID=A0A397SY36_9GLOM|nr:hypothetical protein C1645_853631 [Glomus cerebriforme]
MVCTVIKSKNTNSITIFCFKNRNSIINYFDLTNILQSTILLHFFLVLKIFLLQLEFQDVINFLLHLILIFHVFL